MIRRVNIIVFISIITASYFSLANATYDGSSNSSYSSLSCQLILQAPSWLSAHPIKIEDTQLAEQFIETVILALESMEEEQKNRFQNNADVMGLNNAAGPAHLTQAASVALNNFTVPIHNFGSYESSNAKIEFIERLNLDWIDKRNILFWGYKAYERFLVRHYNGQRENMSFFMQSLNSEYFVETAKVELKHSLMHVFSERFVQDPDLYKTLDFEDLVGMTFEGLSHFEQKIEGLSSPIDLIGDIGHFRIEQWRSSSYEGPTFGVQVYKALTDEMNLTPDQQLKVIENIQGFYAGISAGALLNIMQVELPDRR